MKLTFPRLTTVWVPLQTLFLKNGVELILPPAPSKRTLSLGTKYAPEWICLPYKILLGNSIEGMEMGADTVLSVSGPGLCRLGCYSSLQEAALRDLGYQFEMRCFNWQEKQIVGLVEFLRDIFPGKPLLDLIGDIKFGIQQLMLLDDLERRTLKLRAREAERGAVSRFWRTVPERVGAAYSPAQLKQVRRELAAELEAIPLDPRRVPLRVGMLGEFFMVVDPFTNMDLAIELGHMGVEIERSAWISDWARVWLFLEAVGLSHGNKVKKAASPYLKRDVSGDAIQTLGETVLHSHEGFDGVVHLQPFTCMPEIIAQNMLPQVSREHDIPVLCLVLDEQMGRAGLVTRLEAFVDLMLRRRQKRGLAVAAGV
ncbi:MAG: CoA protein activase [Chloroflexi bacterium]|nr:CoA protein activase [Chloroflexota bacterium]MCL5109534.1 CoA protein activase [Chloroflexota bacterium]